MGIKEAITQLEIIATNIVGRLCELPNGVDSLIVILSKKIEALDMGIDALKTQIDIARCGECKYREKNRYCVIWGQPYLCNDEAFCSYGKRREDEDERDDSEIRR